MSINSSDSLPPDTTDVPSAPHPRGARSPWMQRLRLIVVIGALGTAFWSLRHLDPRRLWGALGGTAWTLVVAAALLNLTLNSIARVLRWRALLGPAANDGIHVGAWRLCSTWLVSQGMNNVLPLRAGDVLRTVSLRDRYLMSGLITAHIAEKVVELLSLTTLGLLLVSAPLASSLGIYNLPAAATVGIGALALLPWGISVAGRALGGRFQATAHALRGFRFKVWLHGLIWSVASDSIDLLLIGLCAVACHVSIGPRGWCAMLLAVNLALVIPSSPGYLGVFEASVVAALGVLRIEPHRAMALAIIYHAIHVIPLTAVGGAIALYRSGRMHQRND